MANLIPMAGLGTRFSKEGYLLSKPLISVSCEPMILRVIGDLPASDKWIFIMRNEHISFGIDKIIKKKIPNAIIISIDSVTEGQACTCLLAKDYLDENEELLIASCDNGFLYDEKKFENLKKRDDIDSIIWTFTRRECLRKNPTAWGWYKLDSDEESILDVSVKIPISENPYSDHAVVATFWFKRARDFIKATEKMILENYRINNEFYMDVIPIFLRKDSKKAVIFDVDLYVGWGTPKDLHEYEMIEFSVKHGFTPDHLPKEYIESIDLWEKYFKK